MPKGIEKEVVKDKFFNEFNLGPLNLKNRFIIPPMCTYMSTDGSVNVKHLKHYNDLSKGGSSLVIVEATSVSKKGNISDNDLTLYEPDKIYGLSKVVDIIHENGALAAIQLNHAGRKSKMQNYNPEGFSDIKFSKKDKDINVLTTNEIDNIVVDFVRSALFAKKAGFDAVEIHAAHGYLIHQSMSPITNNRTDKYADRTLFLTEIVSKIKTKIKMPVIVRFSATEYLKNGFSINFVCDTINKLTSYIDVVHVSSGGAIENFDIDTFSGYQLDFSNIIKRKTNKPVIAVGLLHTPEIINYALLTNKTDCVAIGRACLENPYLINKFKN